ncbi:transmembrane amino acid transporter protein-domain-containing protein [Cristinia sonorae]|uniref:Transmembrane amino acid transporter protein-domain-containing protein n=1 Tax=Cristinia sonorae TaxID=1940300 RepID=A0A8K0UPF4_9AGAR|nr:transmembrane amino acid transporter protein-domain-containing protein [Cristinia sonorae]
MTSPPISISYTSQPSSSFVESYRRSQYYLSDSISASASGEEDFDHDEAFYDEENEIDGPGPGSPPIIREESGEYAHEGGELMGQWEDDDNDLTPGPSTIGAGFHLPIPERPTVVPSSSVREAELQTPTPRAEAREQTPLLRKTTSLSFLERTAPARKKAAVKVKKIVHTPLVRRSSELSTRSKVSLRRPSTAKASKFGPTGQSTFGQTLFNAIAILLGIGMLSEPLAFSYAGWIGGSFLIIFYGFITCYTAKILAHIILADPRLRSYSDIGRKAFGRGCVPWINALFCLELFTVGVALVTLYADSLHSVEPSYSTTFYKCIGITILVPTMLMPLSVLSYASIVGILSTLLIVAVIFIDGFSKPDYPGSLWSPAPTSWGIASLAELGVSFGLFMAGFSGHAVIPSLARDMVDPSQFDKMIDYAFCIATAVYATIGVAGYLMFGNSVSDEFSQDLMKVVGYNPALNKIALWGLVLSPLSKYALATRPLAITIEMLLGIDPGMQIDDHGVTVKPTTDNQEPSFLERHHALKNTFVTIERTLFVILSVAASILVPEFSSMMAFLGAFSAFLLCVIGPVMAKIAMTGKVIPWDAFLLVTAVVMAGWGTGAAFWSTT